MSDFAGVPILTDHRMRDAMLMPHGWKPDFTDRSFVRADCDCDYCRWQPPTTPTSGEQTQ